MPLRQAISAATAVSRIPDGSSVMIGGFMGVGTPNRMIDALVQSEARNLTVIANDAGLPGVGIGKLVSAGAIRHLTASHIGLNSEAQAQLNSGKMHVDLVPQGTLVERIRAGGVGLGGILTETGIGTEVADGKDVIEIDEKRYLVERPLRAEFALIAARRSDYVGNLDYVLTAQNFNPVMALAADAVIAEAESIVPVGVIPPDAVRTPGALVDYILERAR